ncbi:MAG: ATP-dependent Clp protease ATP-binding subunit ClpA, partial [Proteobacteria bacterium]|nr:ATP-dependent Clp protease ATP-binding subunit ClpA [Pseudomonadota bacterium]
MINHDLEVSLNLAVSESARRGNEYVTVEHILFALLQNESAMRAIRACGGSIELTRSKLEDFFAEHIPGSMLKPGQMPQPTVGFQRVIQRAAQHVRSSGKERIKGENILVSMYSERDSFAVYILQQQKISRFDVINYISHGVAKLGDGSDDPSIRLPSAEGEKDADEGTSTRQNGDDEGDPRTA